MPLSPQEGPLDAGPETPECCLTHEFDTLGHLPGARASLSPTSSQPLLFPQRCGTVRLIQTPTANVDQARTTSQHIQSAVRSGDLMLPPHGIWGHCFCDPPPFHRWGNGEASPPPRLLGKDKPPRVTRFTNNNLNFRDTEDHFFFSISISQQYVGALLSLKCPHCSSEIQI